jgi:hypothetical protein
VIVILIWRDAPVTVCFRCHYDTHRFGLMNFQGAVPIIAPSAELRGHRTMKLAVEPAKLSSSTQNSFYSPVFASLKSK